MKRFKKILLIVILALLILIYLGYEISIKAETYTRGSNIIYGGTTVSRK